ATDNGSSGSLQRMPSIGPALASEQFCRVLAVACVACGHLPSKVENCQRESTRGDQNRPRRSEFSPSERQRPRSRDAGTSVGERQLPTVSVTYEDALTDTGLETTVKGPLRGRIPERVLARPTRSNTDGRRAGRCPPYRNQLAPCSRCRAQPRQRGRAGADCRTKYEWEPSQAHELLARRDSQTNRSGRLSRQMSSTPSWIGRADGRSVGTRTPVGLLCR